MVQKSYSSAQIGVYFATINCLFSVLFSIAYRFIRIFMSFTLLSNTQIVESSLLWLGFPANRQLRLTCYLYSFVVCRLAKML